MSKKSTQVALGGLASALCLLLMFMTGMVPFATYALPAAAGFVLIVVIRENGWKAAATVFASVSLLSLFIVPDREAALLFIFFFGHYPITKGKLEKIKIKPIVLILKFLIFNILVVAAYWVIVNIMGIPDILESFGDFGKYSALVLLALGNVFFVIWDFTLTNLTWAYDNWFRPKVLRKFR